MKFRLIYSMVVAGAMLVSCGTPKNIVYFQDAMQGDVLKVENPMEIRIRPKDKLSIIVSCQDVRLMAQFNLPIVAQTIGQGSSDGSSSNSNARGLSGYTVDKNGNIDFPIIGELHVSGMTREEVAAYIKQRLQDEELIKTPVVTVEFMNLGVTVLGEVGKAGRVDINRDNMTLVDAIAQAGDLTITGKRENVMVIREENGRQKVYNVDMTRASSLYSSPVYYLQQNDIVYVEPNNMRIRQSTVNGNTIQTPGFWMSIVNFFISVGNVVTSALLFAK